LNQQDLLSAEPKPDTAISNGLIIQDSSLLIAQDTSYNSKVSKGFTFTDNDSIALIDNFSIQTNNPALFKGHELEPTSSNPIPFKQQTPDWFTIALFITIGFFTWLKLVNGKIIQQLFTAFFNNSVTNQIVRDENILVQKASVLLSAVFYFSAALLLYQVSVYFNWDYKIIGKGFIRFMIFVLFLASAYSFKIVFLKILSSIFQIDRAISTYIFNIFLINNINGILLIPLIMLIAFFPVATNYFIWAGIGILAITFLYRLFRGLAIWSALSSFSLYYFILYLCALEIAPLLIIFKLA
jgi:hypothetical protein